MAELGAATCRFAACIPGQVGAESGRGRPARLAAFGVESASPSNLSEGAREGPRGLWGSGGASADASWGLRSPWGGGDLGPGLREDEPARRPVSACRCQRAVAGAGAAVGRMPVPHRLCAPCSTATWPCLSCWRSHSTRCRRDAHRPPRNPLTPLAQAHPWSLGSSAHPQGGRHDLVTDGPFPWQVDVGAGRW